MKMSVLRFFRKIFSYDDELFNEGIEHTALPLDSVIISNFNKSFKHKYRHKTSKLVNITIQNSKLVNKGNLINIKI